MASVEQKLNDLMLQAQELAARASRDPKTKVGCLLLDAKWKIVGQGVNQAVPSFLPMRRNSNVVPDYVLHAEETALLDALANNKNKIKTCITTKEPCAHCLSLMVGAGVTNFVYIRNNRSTETRELVRVMQAANSELRYVKLGGGSEDSSYL